MSKAAHTVQHLAPRLTVTDRSGQRGPVSASLRAGVPVADLRRRIAEEIYKERQAKISSRDGLMMNSGDFYLGRIAALVALGKVYPKEPREQARARSDEAERLAESGVQRHKEREAKP